jgi:CO dehydrogenase/acetyl-CoA synthase alpha subunit
MATARPETSMEVIVQAAGSTEAAQKLVQSLGGKVGTDLPIIHGFTATIPARILPSLAGCSVGTLDLGRRCSRAEQRLHAVLQHDESAEPRYAGCRRPTRLE